VQIDDQLSRCPSSAPLSVAKAGTCQALITFLSHLAVERLHLLTKILGVAKEITFIRRYCVAVQVKYFCNEAFELGLYGKAIDAYQVRI